MKSHSKTPFPATRPATLVTPARGENVLRLHVTLPPGVTPEEARWRLWVGLGQTPEQVVRTLVADYPLPYGLPPEGPA